MSDDLSLASQVGNTNGAESRVDQLLGRLSPWAERQLEPRLGRRLTHALTEFVIFGVKQAWACLFGGLMVAALLITGVLWPENFPVARYDAMLIYAVLIQIIFLLTKLERPPEALVILVFHLVGTAMEVFKTAQGSWSYPEDSLLRIGSVPLFS
ncbi:MAG: DUF817 family protein, partial [Pseudomonadota bacterium]